MSRPLLGDYARCRRAATPGTILVIIDPQEDFLSGGALPIYGAATDVARIAEMLGKVAFDDVVLSLDSHQTMHVGNAQAWTKYNDAEEAASPFTVLGVSQRESPVPPIAGGPRLPPWEHQQPTKRLDAYPLVAHDKETNEKYIYRDQSCNDVMCTYIKELEEKNDDVGGGRFSHMLWPTHCVLGSYGASIPPVLTKALSEWSLKAEKPYLIKLKGNDESAEAFSAFGAEVSNDNPKTQPDTELMDYILSAKHVYFCGEASSHCVRWSAIDLAERKANKESSAEIHVIVNLTSPVSVSVLQETEFFKLCGTKGIGLMYFDDGSALKEVDLVDVPFARAQWGAPCEEIEEATFYRNHAHCMVKQSSEAYAEQKKAYEARVVGKKEA